MKKLNGILGAVFDMDGLLIDSERQGLIVAFMVEKEMGINVKDEILKSVGRRENETKNAFFNVLGSMELVNEFFNKYNTKLAQYTRENGLPTKSGAIELLDYLKSKKYKIALASSSYKKIFSGNSRNLGRGP